MFKTIPELIFNSIRSFPQNVALRYQRDGGLHDITYEELGTKIKHIFYGLRESGLKPGDKVAILSNNCPEWAISDLALFSLRAVVVPVYQTLPSQQIAYILKDSGARAIFVQNDLQYDKIVEIRNQLPQLEFVFTFEPIDLPDNPETFQQIGIRGSVQHERHPQDFEKSLAAIESTDICSLVYTSGTTGDPKGVMLHHKGFVSDIVNAEAVLNLQPSDVFLSFLPLSHLYERLAGHWCPLYKGGTVFYAQSIDTVVDDISLAKPTAMVSVPRLYEKIANKVQEQVEEGPVLKQKIFYWAIGIGLQYHEARINGKISPWLKRQYTVAEKLVFNKIRAKLGGRFRFPIAGGAPLSVETLKFFEAIGMRIIEGYGMTETHLILTLTPAGQTRYGSCGKPIGGVEMKIADDGEVMVRGDLLMKGYYNKPELTAEIIDKDGWLHTGDIGYMDKDRYLYLTDRKKNIIVTAGGKNVAPAPIEHKLKGSKFIDDVCLVGNKRKFISALIMPNAELLGNWAAEHKIAGQGLKELTHHPAVQKLFQKEIDRLQQGLAQYETVKKFILLEEPLTVDKGELTPSLKIKRSVVENNFKQQIDQLYA